jgi:hypothetical protein
MGRTTPMNEEQPTIDDLKALVVQAFTDLDMARHPPEHEKDPTGERWFNACQVLKLAEGLYGTEAKRIFAALPFAATVRNVYNSNGQNTDGGAAKSFGNRKHTYHIVPDAPYPALRRPIGQPLCKVLKVPPYPLAGWQANGHADWPTCHECLRRAEMLIESGGKVRDERIAK